MTPKAYQSAAAFTGCIATCSGAMYSGVPAPDCVVSIEAALTRPKSSSTARPSAVTSTFDGLTSRWTQPAACSAASARASWASTGRNRSSR